MDIIAAAVAAYLLVGLVCAALYAAAGPDEADRVQVAAFVFFLWPLAVAVVVCVAASRCAAWLFGWFLDRFR